MIIQKFGGTSLGKQKGINNIINIIADTLAKESVVVVVSALSDKNKKEGTTAKLIEASQLAIKGKTSFLKIIQELQEKHTSCLKPIKNPKIVYHANNFIEKKLTTLKEFLKAISIIGEMTSKSEDNILGVGEQLAAKIFTCFLEDNKIQAKYIDLANTLKQNSTEPNNLFFVRVEKKLQEYQKQVQKKVLVFTGFFGSLQDGILSNLGRGYTDFTASLLATALKANELQIWKEVDGVFSADPNLISQAKLLPSIHPEEAGELTYYGSEVIHSSVISYITKKEIPIRIKNTFFPKKAGTLIDKKKSSVISGAIAVTCKKNILVINIHSNKMLMAYGFMAKIFEVFKKYKVIIDIIATSEVNVSLTLDNQKIPKSMLQELDMLGRVSIQDKMSIISLVGRGLRKKIGSASEMFSVLAKGNINIEVISQGSSEINISCVIRSKDADKAIGMLHKKILEK